MYKTMYLSDFLDIMSKGVLFVATMNNIDDDINDDNITDKVTIYKGGKCYIIQNSLQEDYPELANAEVHHWKLTQPYFDDCYMQIWCI